MIFQYGLKNAVYVMLNAGYISGYEDGSFGANRNMTRAEAISMLDRINKSNKSYENEKEMPQNDTIESTYKNNDEINMLEQDTAEYKKKQLQNNMGKMVTVVLLCLKTKRIKI